MAKKAQKSQAARNSAKLLQTHAITSVIHLLFHLRRLLLSSELSRSSWKTYAALVAPAVVLEVYLERIGRPRYNDSGAVVSGGEDLDGKGLMEWMWDIIYWTWINLIVVTIFGDKGWYLWAAIPVYSLWLLWSTVGNIRQGLGGLGGSEINQEPVESKRQKKMEKRGGQKIQYAR